MSQAYLTQRVQKLVCWCCVIRHVINDPSEHIDLRYRRGGANPRCEECGIVAAEWWMETEVRYRIKTETSTWLGHQRSLSGRR